MSHSTDPTWKEYCDAHDFDGLDKSSGPRQQAPVMPTLEWLDQQVKVGEWARVQQSLRLKALEDRVTELEGHLGKVMND